MVNGADHEKLGKTIAATRSELTSGDSRYEHGAWSAALLTTRPVHHLQELAP